MEKVENYIKEEVQPKTMSSPIKKGPYFFDMAPNGE
jgi:hypothetical protein